MANQKKILVVDDDRDILESITLILESEGYRVRAVESGEECLDVLGSEKPDLVILDNMLETIMAGLNVCLQIRSRPDFLSIPIVMISSIEKHTGLYIDKDYLPIEAFLEKPFQPSALLDIVGSLLS